MATPTVASSALPSIDAIITTLLSTARPLEEVLAEAGAKLAAAPSLLADDCLVRAMTALAQLAEQRARIIAAEATVSAIHSLKKIIAVDVQDPRHAETLRKACSSIIRLSESLHKRAGAAPATAAPHLQPPPGRSPAPLAATPLVPIPRSANTAPAPAVTFGRRAAPAQQLSSLAGATSAP